ncbi:MAG TPA: SAM-dependent methyltransferase, partial [Sphingomicrobium sp.]|nr:SAM-dependent methyltransferase [Sphingomicrobium sp.]
MAALFDMNLRAMRRDRAARLGAELFLYERVFEDCLERVELTNRRFERALLIGCPNQQWPARLARILAETEVRDPGSLFAHAAGGEIIVEDAWEPRAGAYDLVFAIGTLDSTNDLPLALNLIGHAMSPGGLFIGAFSGGNTLPRLRAAMRAADSSSGTASPHVHPRIEAAAVAPLLSSAGFANPVIDIDQIEVGYPSFDRLIADLRRMGVTNILSDRSREPMTRAAHSAAKTHFQDAGRKGRT